MAVLTEIRKRSWLLLGVIAIALLAFLVNPSSIDKVFGKDPNILGKVNGEEITRDDFNDQLFVMQQQAMQQGQPTKGLEEKAWDMVVQSKLIKQQFEKMGIELTDDMFWSQLQFDPMFANQQQLFDEKGNFRIQEIKKQIDEMKNNPNPQFYSQWLKTRKSIEYRMMARQVFANVSTGITTSNKVALEMIKQRDNSALIDYVAVDYNAYALKNPVKVTTQDLADYIKLHPNNFKTGATRNLGFVYFPAKPTPDDEAVTMNEINKLFAKGTDASNGTENFQNTKNDSMFVALNSDASFNPQYFSANQLPAEIKDKVAGMGIGQSFGPYKTENAFVVSKLMDKKTQDSTLSSHILIAYKGAERSVAARTKEEAKVLADKLMAEIKSNPARFNENLKLSDEPNAEQRGGSVGWTTPQSQFASGYLAFLASNSKGAIGLAETPFGYHIIKVDDKKSGEMAYKLANLVKAIKPSDKTEADVDKAARRFIQQTQGKSFNDFQNLAKKSNFNFQNPQSIKRFDGQLQGLGTDKDEEIISWAFDKKRKQGETEFFQIDGTGDRVVVIFNGKQDAGIADPESVRMQIEQEVKNKLLAKKIFEKIEGEKIISLDQFAKVFGTEKLSGQVNMLNPQLGVSMEPRVAGAAFALADGKASKPIEGMSGVYMIVKKSVTTNKQPADAKQVAKAISQQEAQMFGQSLMKSLRDNADIKDYRIEVWDKVARQE